MKPGENAKRAAHVPSSGRGASSALEAMIRKRIPAPGSQGSAPAQDRTTSPQAGWHKRRP